MFRRYKLKKKNVIICSVILAIIIIAIIIVAVIFSGNKQEIDDMPIQNEQEEVITNKAPSKIDANEKDVSEKKKQELFNFIPKVYTEGISPFDSLFMLDAVMKKIINANENPDFSVSNVDKFVTKVFGEGAKINKEDVSAPDVARSYFYYSKEANSYAIIPVGYEGKFEYQIFKNATETEDAYYVYTYVLIGGYSYDENSITVDEFGDIDYENTKVQVIIGDKDGNDLVHIFDNYSLMYDESLWTAKYSNIMPIFRYTLTKNNKEYYLTEVEQINY